MGRDDITSAMEDYLEAILRLSEASAPAEEGGRASHARVRDIAKALGVTQSTVSGALRSLKRRGLVNYAPYEVVTLTDDGRAAAERVDRRHRRLVGFLAGVLGIEQGLAEAEACRLEHGLSRATADGLAGLVEFLEERPAVMAEWRKALGRRGRETGAGSDRPGTANTAGGNR